MKVPDGVFSLRDKDNRSYFCLRKGHYIWSINPLATVSHAAPLGEAELGLVLDGTLQLILPEEFISG